MGSSFNGPPGPNDQLFNDTNDDSLSGPVGPNDGRADDTEKNVEELLDKKTGAAAGE